MGHRTPQGLTFAPDGRLWEIEHGPRGGDEATILLGSRDRAVGPGLLSGGDLFPQWKSNVLVGGLAGQAIFRLELGKDDKVVNEEPLLADLHDRIRDVRVFQDGAVYVLTDGAGGKLLKLTPK